jgi:predicted ATPase
VQRSTFIQRVVLRNFKSIGYCDVRLKPLTYMAGQNGAGKSNFLDALHFVGDSLTGSLENAIRERGGLNEMRRRSSGHPTNFGIYREMLDQPAFAARFDLRLAHDNSRSFRKLCKKWQANLQQVHDV